jgi:hypothetical protein
MSTESPTTETTPDEMRDRQRKAAREAFADRTDAEGALSISTQRNPWEALDDALAAAWAVRDEELKLLRDKVTAHDFAVDANVARLGKRVDRAEAERDATEEGARMMQDRVNRLVTGATEHRKRADRTEAAAERAREEVRNALDALRKGATANANEILTDLLESLGGEGQ